MTAFANHSVNSDGCRLTWELRAVNHRFLELGIRLPEDVRPLEPQFRERISRQVKRGKVDVQLRVERDAVATAGLAINTQLLSALVRACDEVHSITGVTTTPSALELLRWPGVVESAQVAEAELAEAAAASLEEAIASFVATRQREGQRIIEFLQARIQEASQHIAGLKLQLPQLLQTQRERLLNRIADFGVQVDPERLEQELVLLAQRLDVAEEIDRLETHLVEVQRCLNEREPVGRRLDFLMQELNREANTLGSKSQHLESTNTSLSLKVIIEQMREQVQNIE